MEMPDPSKIIAGIMTLGVIGQFFGLSLPNIQRADANKAARYSCLDALKESNTERTRLLDIILEGQE